MLNSAIAAALIFLMVCFLTAMYQSHSFGRVRLIEWSALAMGGVYGGVWVLIILDTAAGRNPFWQKWLLPNVDLYLVHTLCSFIALGCAYLGWKVFGGILVRREAHGELPSGDYSARLAFLAWVLLFVSAGMQFFYTKAYGGLLGVFEYANLMRAGVFTQDNPFSFLQPFGGLALFSSFIFLGLLLSGCRQARYFLGFFFAFLFSIYVLLSWQGRLGFLTYFAAIILGFLFRLSVRPGVLIVGGGVLLVGMVVVSYEISSVLQIKASESLAFFIAKELSFPFGGFFAHLTFGDDLTRFFIDFLVSPFYVLPSSWWLGMFETVGQVNTELIMGAKKGDLGVTGAVPVDLLTLGLMQASIVGVAVVGFMFGGLLRTADHLLWKIPNVGVRSVLEAYVVVKIAVLSIFYAEPQIVVAGNFDLIVCAASLMVIKLLPARS